MSAEIGAEQISKDVQASTKNLADTTMIQLGMVTGIRPIIDADGDGVEDNEHKTQAELDRFRKMVFSAPVEDLYNTQNGEIPGHVRYGEDPEPANLQTTTDVHADARANNEYDSEPKEKVEAAAQVMIRPIIDADGDGVEDNVERSQEELDRTRKKVFGETVHDLHNTRNGELPGHHNFGDHPEPTGVHIQDTVHQPEAAEAIAVQADTNLGVNVSVDDRSLNEGDASYLMTSEQVKLSSYISRINSPEDLALLQTHPRRAIYDADGDGIEDNRP